MGFTLVQPPRGGATEAPKKRYRLAAPPAPDPNDATVFKREPARQAPAMSAADLAEDAVKSLGVGAVRGATQIAGMPGDARALGDWLGEKAADALGLTEQREWIKKHATFGEQPKTSPEMWEDAKELFRPAPTVTDLVTGKKPESALDRQPQSTLGEYSNTAGEFLAGSFGPGGPIRKGAQWLIPAILSESAGQATKGSEYEPMARFAFGLGGGLLTAGGKVNAAKLAAKNAPTQQAVNASRDALYGQLRNAGIKYDANAYGQFASDLRQKLDAIGIDPVLHPAASRTLKRIEREVNTSPDFTKMETLRQIAGDATRGFDPRYARDRYMAGEIIDALDNFSMSAPFISKPGVTRDIVMDLSNKARATAQKSIKGRKINSMIAEAEGYSHGYDAGLRAQFQKLERDIAKGKERGWTKTEIEAIRQAAHGTKMSNALNTVGRAGFDLGTKGNRALALPGALAALVADLSTTGGALTAAKVIGGLAATSGAKVAGRKMTEAYADRVLKTVLAGKGPQNAARNMSQKELEAMIIRRIIAGDSSLNSSGLRDEPSMATVLAP